MEDVSCSAGLLSDLLRAIDGWFSYIGQDHLTKDGPAQNGLSLLLLVDKILPICMAISQSETNSFLVEALF